VGMAGPITNVGDSLAAHPIRRGLAQGQESGKVGVYNQGDTAVAGWGPAQILSKVIPNIPDQLIKDQVVNLSTGASNNPSQLDFVPEQIKALRERGAKNIVVMGVGTSPKLAGVNDKLAQIAQDNGVAFAGPQLKTQSDQIHSSDQAAEMGAVRQALGKVQPGTPTVQPAVATKGVDELIRTIPNEPGEVPDAQIPGLTERLQKALSNPEVQKDPRLADYVVKKARAEANMAWSQAQHARQADQQAQKATDEAILQQIQPRMQPGNPNPVTQQELASVLPKLSAEAQRTVIGFYHTAVKPPPDAAMSAQNERLLYGGITNGTITDLGPINNAYTSNDPNERISEEALGRLTNKIKELQGDRSRDWEAGFNNVFKVVESKIMPALITAGTRNDANMVDKEGATRVLRWQQAVEAKKLEYLKAGKNPMILLQTGTPDKPNPEYVGNEDFWLAAAGPPPQPPKPDEKGIDLTTLPGIRKAIKDHPERQQEFLNEGIKRGLLRPNAAAPPPATVGQAPMAR
jgi:hypothetical protein